MNRRDLLRTTIAGGLAVTALPASANAALPHDRHCPVTGPDHPLAPKRELLYGLGETAAQFMDAAMADFHWDCWMLWAGIRNTTPDDEVPRWGTDLYPFSERNVSRLLILTRLGDAGAGLVAATLRDWAHRVPTEIILLAPHADVAARQRAERQRMALAGHSAAIRPERELDEVQRLLDIRSGYLFVPEDA